MATALITGATQGLGYEFSKQMAAKGVNLVLVARNELRLQEISQELSAKGVMVITYAKDLSLLSNAEFIYNDLEARSIQIDYLINNAGFGIGGDYVDIDWEKELGMYNLNMITISYFTKTFARAMKSRGEGRILNIASTGAFQPGPFLAGYCATKAFVLSLSEAVNRELKGTGVSVTALCPGVTDTKFHDVADTNNTGMVKNLTHATAAEVARYGIRLMMKPKAMGVHGMMNKLVVFTNRITPRCIVTAIAAKVLKRKA